MSITQNQTNKQNSEPIDPVLERRKNVISMLDGLLQLPDQLASLYKSHGDYSIAIEEIDKEIEGIYKKLHPKKHLLSGEMIERLNKTEKAVLSQKLQQLKLFRRRLQKEECVLGLQSRKVALISRYELKVEEQKEKVKDPNYYNKYGEFIPGAIIKFLNPKNSTMQEARYNSLKALKDLSVEEFFNKIADFLYKEDQILYVRCTGTSEAKVTYFKFFYEQLQLWDATKILIVQGDKNGK